MIFDAEKQWYKEIIHDCEVVFDVGCKSDNVFYDIDPSLEIHLFDPKPHGRKMHGKFNRIALSDKKGEAIFYPEYSSMERRNLKGPKWEWVEHLEETITTDTLDNYCRESGIKKIDLLKIDTEGHDLNVLLGAAEILPNIKYIQFEQWNDDKTQTIISLLKDYDIETMKSKPINYKCTRK